MSTFSSMAAGPFPLFSDDPSRVLEAFAKGGAGEMVRRRNPFLGSLLNTERALYYVQILYRLLLFRRDHEMEPLHEDIFHSVQPAQEALEAGPYPIDQFNLDLNQLLAWDLVRKRLEKERIRGYKDTRRSKFRYSLSEEAIAFLLWLEERLQEDFEDKTPDARDLLEEVLGTVKELVRHLRKFQAGDTEKDDAPHISANPVSHDEAPHGAANTGAYDGGLRTAPNPENDRDRLEASARRILFQIYKSHQLTQEIGISLTEFHARLLAFLNRNYELEELRQILAALNHYVDRYLRQLGRLRAELLPDLRKLDKPLYRERMTAAFAVMEQERLSVPRVLRARGDRLSPAHIPHRLIHFYADGGALDGLCRRINGSALRLWRRMSAHLKELERRSHRLEDLKARMAEIARLPEGDCPTGYLEKLLSWGHMRADLHEWNEEQLADPPLPRRGSWRHRKSPAILLRPKHRSTGAIQTLEEARLEELANWIHGRLLADGPPPVPVSRGAYREQEDFESILQLAKAGLLAKGKKLAGIGFSLRPDDLPAEVRIESNRLRFLEMIVGEAGGKRAP